MYTSRKFVHKFIKHTNKIWTFYWNNERNDYYAVPLGAKLMTKSFRTVRISSVRNCCTGEQVSYLWKISTLNEFLITTVDCFLDIQIQPNYDMKDVNLRKINIISITFKLLLHINVMWKTTIAYIDQQFICILKFCIWEF